MIFPRSTALFLILAGCLDIVNAQPKVVSMRFKRSKQAHSIQKIKRDTLNVGLGNAQRGTSGLGIYYVNCSVGTPGQEVQLQLDTGSSDLWMFSEEACESNDIMCLGGIFNPDDSSTFKSLYTGEFNISYITAGSGVHGDYISDNIELAGAKITKLTMGLAKEVRQIPTGIMGIGYKENEAIAAQTGGRTTYPNLVDLMVNQKIINTRAYSLFLDDRDQAEGTILFGGYDTEKFSGRLSLLDILPDQTGDITSFSVAWTGFTVSTPDQGDIVLTGSEFVQPVVLDSGTTLTYLPAELAVQLAEAAGAQLDTSSGAYLLYCDASDVKATLKYQFGGASGPTIEVAFRELILPFKDTDGKPVTDGGREVCIFGILSADEGDLYLFGDTFLRSAYVVYDLDGQTIGIAQAVNRASKSNIVEINGKLEAGLQGVSSVPGQVIATQTATSRGGGFGTIQTGAATSVLGSPTDNGSPSFTLGIGTSTPSNTSKPNGASVTYSFDRTGFMIIVGSILLTAVGGVFVAL